MESKWSVAGVAAGTAAGAAAIAAGLHYWLLRRPLPQTRGTISEAGLAGRVELLRDTWGVPHIYAGTIPDLMFAQGYVHAQDRFWQMEFWRRLTAGRLAELLGAPALPVDRWVRVLGLRRVAEQEVEGVDGEVRQAAEAYVAGINARLERGPLPLECTLLRYTPEPWCLADTLAWSKMMAWQLSVNWQSEIIRAQLLQRFGPELLAGLDQPPEGPLVVPAEVDYAVIGGAALRRDAGSRPFLGPPAGAGLGSNNWVVDGSRTASGKPLLANDMHLTMSIPAIWYENHLACPEEGFNVTGVTFAGVPGVISGHNGRVAWGFTNGFPDVQDLYIERLRQEPDGTVCYEFRGEWRPATVRRERIRVKGQAEPVVETIVETHHGPVINSLAVAGSAVAGSAVAGSAVAGSADGHPMEEAPLALRWTALEPDRQFLAVHAMNRAQDCRQFHQATRFWSAPVQNMVYADVEGNIGYTFPGRLPIRAKGDGRLPVPGWSGEYEWLGYVPFEEWPHFLNPPQAEIVSANNRVVDESYPYTLGNDFSLGDRAERIAELLHGRQGLTVADMTAMQFDWVSPTARKVARHLANLSPGEAERAGIPPAAWSAMRRWSGELAPHSQEAAIYQVFMRALLRRLLQGKLGDLTPFYAGMGLNPILAPTNQLGPRSWEWLARQLDDPSSPWFDLGQGADQPECLRLALADAAESLRQELGPDWRGWTWGRLHRLELRHTLAANRLLQRLLNRGPFPLGGDGTTVFATGNHLHDLDSDRLIGPPYRMVVDLGDLRRSVSLLAPGQSGHPGSRHYDDQLESFFAGHYHPMLYERDDVLAGTRDRLVLAPAGV